MLGGRLYFLLAIKIFLKRELIYCLFTDVIIDKVIMEIVAEIMELRCFLFLFFFFVALKPEYLSENQRLFNLSDTNYFPKIKDN